LPFCGGERTIVKRDAMFVRLPARVRLQPHKQAHFSSTYSVMMLGS